MKKISFGLLFFLNFSLNAQIEKFEKVDIIQQIEDVNKLILHINSNIISIKTYQEKLLLWAENPSESIQNIPTYKFKPFAHHNLFTYHSTTSVDIDFNYKSAATRLYKQSLLFNKYCQQLEKNSTSSSKTSVYNQKATTLKQIEKLSDEWVNLCYNFSLSASINFGKEILPSKLDLIKNLVAQSKNIIMAMRDNNPIQVRSYLSKFNTLVVELNKISRTELIKEGKFKISQDELENIIQTLVKQSYEIGAWTEQYLQTSLENKEITPIIFETVKAFNSLNNHKGTASLYNYLCSYSDLYLLKFTEEPLSFEARISQKIKEQAQPQTIKTPTTPLVVETKVEESEISKPIQKVEFDKNNIQTLEGAMPSNIVFLMDVSPSMKKDNKLSTLQSTILHYANLMRPEDRISLIAFSGKAKVLLKGGTRYELEEIRKVVNSLFSTGGTDIENGFIYAYEIAEQTFMKKGNNRVILATDGEFGMRGKVLDFIKEKAEKNNIYLSIFHFNTQNIPTEKARLENMVKLGRGNYQYITTGQQAIKALISEIKIKAIE